MERVSWTEPARAGASMRAAGSSSGQRGHGRRSHTYQSELGVDGVASGLSLRVARCREGKKVERESGWECTDEALWSSVRRRAVRKAQTRSNDKHARTTYLLASGGHLW